MVTLVCAQLIASLGFYFVDLVYLTIQIQTTVVFEFRNSLILCSSDRHLVDFSFHENLSVWFKIYPMVFVNQGVLILWRFWSLLTRLIQTITLVPREFIVRRRCSLTCSPEHFERKLINAVPMLGTCRFLEIQKCDTDIELVFLGFWTGLHGGNYQRTSSNKRSESVRWSQETRWNSRMLCRIRERFFWRNGERSRRRYEKREKSWKTEDFGMLYLEAILGNVFWRD